MSSGGDFFGGPSPRRLNVDRMRKRVGGLPAPESVLLPLHTWEDLGVDRQQAILTRLALRLRRALPEGATLRADLRVVDPPYAAGMGRAELRRGQQVEVTVSARRRTDRRSSLDRLFGNTDPPEYVMEKVRRRTAAAAESSYERVCTREDVDG